MDAQLLTRKCSFDHLPNHLIDWFRNFGEGGALADTMFMKMLKPECAEFEVERFLPSDPHLLHDLRTASCNDSHKLLRRLECATRQHKRPSNTSDSEVQGYILELVSCYFHCVESIKLSRAIEKLWQPYLKESGSWIKNCFGKWISEIIGKNEVEHGLFVKFSTVLEQNKIVQEEVKEKLGPVCMWLQQMLTSLLQLPPAELKLNETKCLYAVVKICLQMFQTCSLELSPLIWHSEHGPTTLYPVVDFIVESLIEILRSKSYAVDCTLLAGTSVALMLNTSQNPYNSALAFWKILHFVITGNGLPLNFKLYSEHKYADFAPKGVNVEIDNSHIGALSFVRGVTVCGSEHLLKCGSLSEEQLLPFLLEIFPIVKSFCKGPITIHYHAFQLLSMWFSRLNKIQFDGDVEMDKFVTPILAQTLELIWLNWDSPVEDVPESIVGTFQSCMEFWERHQSHDQTFTDEILSKLLHAPWYTKGKYRILGSLVKYVDFIQLVQKNPEIQLHLLKCLSTNHLTSVATDVYKASIVQIKSRNLTHSAIFCIHIRFKALCECLWTRKMSFSAQIVVRKSSKCVEEETETWKNSWLCTLEKGLLSSNSLLRYNTSLHWVPCTFKTLRGTAECLLDHLTELMGDGKPTVCHTRSLHAWVVAAKVSRTVLGINLLDSSFVTEALYCADDDVRSEGLSLLCSTLKKAEPLSSTESSLLTEFLPYNMKVDSAPFRQHLASDMKKMLVRIRDSCISMTKTPDKHKEALDRSLDFVDRLHNLCMECLLPGACYQKRKTSLDLLHVLYDTLIYSAEGRHRKGFTPEGAVKLMLFAEARHRWKFFTVENAVHLVYCLLDGADEVQLSASQLLLRYYPWPLYDEHFGDLGCHLLAEGLQLCNSPKAYESQSGALIVTMIYRKYVVSLSYVFNLKFDKASSIYDVSMATEKSHDACIQFLECLLAEIKRCCTLAGENLVEAAKTFPIHGLVNCVTRCLTEMEDSAHPGLSTVVCDLVDTSISIINSMLAVMARASQQDSCPSFAEIGIALESLVTESQLECSESTSLSPEYQYLLSWCWNNVKESCTSLASVTAFTVSNMTSKTLINESVVQRIIDTFLTVLTKCRHKGVIEGCRSGFSKFCSVLVTSPNVVMQSLPENILQQILENLKNNVMTASITRKSAGLPIIIQAVLLSEKKMKKSLLLTKAVESLFDLSSLPLASDWDGLHDLPQVHGLNILKCLFSDATLSTSLMGYISRAVILVVGKFASPSWAIRNAATRLFSTLMTRIFGQKKPGENITCNSITFQEFSAHYPELPPFLLELIIDATSCDVKRLENLHPGVFPALTVLAGLKPMDFVSDSLNSIINDMKQHVLLLLSSPVYQLRHLAASAVVALTDAQSMPSLAQQYIQHQLSEADLSKRHCNTVHGYLILIDMFLEYVDSQNEVETLWGMLQSLVWTLEPVTCYVTSTQVLHTLAGMAHRFPELQLSEDIQNLLLSKVQEPENLSQVGECLYYIEVVKLLMTATCHSERELLNAVATCLRADNLEVRKSCLSLLKEHSASVQISQNLSVQLQEVLGSLLSKETYVPNLANQVELITTLSLSHNAPPGVVGYIAMWLMEATNRATCQKFTSLSSGVLPIEGLCLGFDMKTVYDWCERVHIDSQSLDNDTRRQAAAMALKMVKDMLLQRSEVSQKMDKAFVLLMKTCFNLIQDEDTEIRKKAANVISGLHWKNKEVQFSSVQSSTCVKLLMDYIISLRSSECLMFICQTLFTPGSLKDLYKQKKQDRKHQLFEQEDNNFFAEKLFNGFLLHQALQAGLKACMSSNELKNGFGYLSSASEAVQPDLVVLLDMLTEVQTGTVINLLTDASVFATICGLLLLCDIILQFADIVGTSDMTSFRDIKWKITDALQHQNLPVILKRKLTGVIIKEKDLSLTPPVM